MNTTLLVCGHVTLNNMKKIQCEMEIYNIFGKILCLHCVYYPIIFSKRKVKVYRGLLIYIGYGNCYVVATVLLFWLCTIH